MIEVMSSNLTSVCVCDVCANFSNSIPTLQHTYVHTCWQIIRAYYCGLRDVSMVKNDHMRYNIILLDHGTLVSHCILHIDLKNLTPYRSPTEHPMQHACVLQHRIPPPPLASFLCAMYVVAGARLARPCDSVNLYLQACMHACAKYKYRACGIIAVMLTYVMQIQQRHTHPLSRYLCGGKGGHVCTYVCMCLLQHLPFCVVGHYELLQVTQSCGHTTTDCGLATTKCC